MVILGGVDKMDIKDIKELIITIDKTSIEEVKIEKSDIKIMISKRSDSEGRNETKTIIDNLETKNIETKVINNEKDKSKSECCSEDSMEVLADDENTFIVKSPIVGTFYEAASPDSAPFVKIGDKVEKGQTLCIIEAMKIMNEIECEAEGQVVEIFVADEDIVEYGQPLMKIRR